MSARTAIKILISVGLTVAALYLVLSRSDIPSFAVLFTQLPAILFFIIIALSVLATALAVWRFKLIAQDLGYRVTIRDSIAALSLGLLAGMMFFQLVGQLMARGALLSRRGVPVAATVTLTIYERAAAAGVSLMLAVAGGWYVFGRMTLDVEHGGLVFLKIVAGLTLAIAAGGWLAWGSKTLAAAPQKIDRAFFGPIIRNVLISAAIQLSTMTAYVVTAHTLAPAVPLLDLAAAAAVVMLAAALPISLAGWGVRELSAVVILSVVGVPTEAALIVAILIGVTSLLVTGAFAVTSLWPEVGSVQVSERETSPAIDYSLLLIWAVPILAATLVFFQLYIPVGKGQLNVNLADPLAILGGTLFFISAVSTRRWPAWRLSWFNGHILAITAVLTIALLHGAVVFGWTPWALTNRFAGWFILIGYAATAAMLVHRCGREGLIVLLRTFAAVSCSIVALDLFLIVLATLGIEMPNAVLFLRMGGFAQNPNAFAFQVLLALCASSAADFRPRIATLVTTICFVGIWFAASRAVFMAVPFVLALAIHSRAMPLRQFVASAVFAGWVIGLVVMLPSIASVIVALPQIFDVYAPWLIAECIYIPQYILNHVVGWPDPLPSPPAVPAFPNLEINSPKFRYNVSGVTSESSNVERIESLQIALRIFLDHPVFGGGLGLFVANYIQQFGKVLVIHSTPLWLLAETGIVGFVIVGALYARVVVAEFGRAIHGERVASLIILILMALGIVSLVHELFYQRSFWLLFGAAMAMVPVAGLERATEPATKS